MVYWDYCFKVIVYLINWFPFKTLNLKSPFKLLYQTKPNYIHFRVFGCLSFTYMRLFNSNKLELRSLPYIFLRYATAIKDFGALNLYQEEYMLAYISFNETVFPFLTHVANTDVQPGNVILRIIRILMVSFFFLLYKYNIGH